MISICIPFIRRCTILLLQHRNLKTASTASDIQLFVHGVKLTSICSELEAPTTPYLVLLTIGFKRHLKENQGTFTNETIDYFSSFWQLRCDVSREKNWVKLVIGQRKERQLQLVWCRRTIVTGMRFIHFGTETGVSAHV